MSVLSSVDHNWIYINNLTNMHSEQPRLMHVAVLLL